MKLLMNWILILSVGFSLLLSVSIPGQAIFSAASMPLATPAPTPRTPDTPPITPDSLLRTYEALPSSSTILYQPPLKAVLLVGPIDGDYGPGTQDAKQHMNLAAAELQANGVNVHKFYTPNNDWEQIKAAANGAHFLFYRGHGVYWGSMPYPPVGGFSLKNRFASPDDIRNDLNLAPNAIVMLYGCFTAGSTSLDTVSITSAEAKRRVAQYSDPFFDIGAGGYYANWFGDAFQMFVRYLFQGKTLGQAYEAYFDFNSATVERYTHPDHPEMVLWLDKDYWYDPKPQYNNAFAGQATRTMADLWPAMVVTPASLAYMAEPTFPSRTFLVQVDHSSTGSFTWTAEITPTVSWLHAQPLSGNNGDHITVTITPTVALGTFQTNLHVETGDPQLYNSDQTIPVTLYVAEQIYHHYLPVVFK